MRQTNGQQPEAFNTDGSLSTKEHSERYIGGAPKRCSDTINADTKVYRPKKVVTTSDPSGFPNQWWGS